MSNPGGQRSGSLYRRVWRWHFYAGVFVGPIVSVVALTGFGYVFKREIEVLLYPDVLLASEPVRSEQPLDKIVASAEDSAGEGWSTRLVEVDVDQRRAFGVFLEGPEDSHQRIFVDQYTAEPLGGLSEDSLFPVLLKLHRQLFMGQFGRMLTELSTSWGVILVATGLYLWWPRSARRNRSVWFPRVRGYNYASLRNLHAVMGAWASVPVVLIAVTGLVYSVYWGAGFWKVVDATGGGDLLPEWDAPALDEEALVEPWGNALRAARREAPGLLYTIENSGKSDAVKMVYAGPLHGPSLTRILVVDAVTGSVHAASSFADFPAMGKWTSLNYPLHTGTILGLPSKLLWAASSLLLAFLPISGFLMWLKRKPRGTLGLPVRPGTPPTPAVLFLVVALALLFPVAGATILATAVVDYGLLRFLRLRS
ncbi:MAG: PepSY-associated TM helix domain-containing protein [Planctomycetota bacterium]